MAIPWRELSTTPLKQLKQKYGQEELDDSERMLAQSGSIDVYIQKVDNDPAKLSFLDPELYFRVASGWTDKIGKPLEDLTKLPQGLKSMYEMGPIDAASSIVSGLKDRYGSTDALKRTMVDDPFGMALDFAPGMSSVGRIAKLGKAGKLVGALSPTNLAAKAARAPLNIAEEVVPHGVAAYSGVDIGKLRAGWETAMRGSDAERGVMKSQIMNESPELAAKAGREGVRDYQSILSTEWKAKRSEGDWDNIEIPSNELQTRIASPIESIWNTAKSADSNALRNEGKGSLINLAKKDIDELLSRDKITVENVRAVRQGLQVLEDRAGKFQFKNSGRVIREMRGVLSEAAKKLSPDLDAADAWYVGKSEIAKTFELATKGRLPDERRAALSKMLDEENPIALKALKEVQDETGIPLLAMAAGAAMSTTAPIGLAGQSAFMRALRAFVPVGAGYAAGGPLGAAALGYAGTKIASPQAIGKVISGAGDIYNKTPLRRLHEGYKTGIKSPFNQTVMEGFLYGGLQGSRNREKK